LRTNNKDLYSVLGVSREASFEEIKSSYRRLAKELHPDVNKDDPECAEKFKELTQAYEVLSDSEKRARYDRFGTDKEMADPFGGMSDIFETFFGDFFGVGQERTRRTVSFRGEDRELVVGLTYFEAINGAPSKTIEYDRYERCEKCEGKGSTSGKKTVCKVCHGTGQVTSSRRTLLGNVYQTYSCPECNGKGFVIEDPCPHCRGTGRTISKAKISIDIPPFSEEGKIFKVRSGGNSGSYGEEFGDLYVQIRYINDERFIRDGYNLIYPATISFPQAVLGTKIKYYTPDAEEGFSEYEIPAGVQPYTEFKIRGKGLPKQGGRVRGDLILRTVIQTPTEISDEEKELYVKLAQLRGEYQEKDNIFKKIKKKIKK